MLSSNGIKLGKPYVWSHSDPTRNEKYIYICIHIYISLLHTLVQTGKEGLALRPDHRGGPLGGRGLRSTVSRCYLSRRPREYQPLGPLRDCCLSQGRGGRPHSPASLTCTPIPRPLPSFRALFCSPQMHTHTHTPPLEGNKALLGTGVSLRAVRERLLAWRRPPDSLRP